MKILLGLIILIVASSAQTADLCDQSGILDEGLQGIQDVLKAPSIHASFELNKDCDFEVLTTTYTGSKKSLKDFVKELTDPIVNRASANSNVKSYFVIQNSDGSYEQSIKASKSIMTATIVSTCKYIVQTDAKIVYECNLKDGAGVLKNNKSVITCTNSSDDLKKCIFQTNGRAIGQFMKSACTLACGGAAETVNSIQRLLEYVTYGKVDASKWEKPGKIFYKTISGHDASELKNKKFVFQQQIQ